LATVPPGRAGTAVYGITALDRNGRIADRVVLRALGWTTGVRLVIDATRTLVTLHPATDDSSGGGSCVTPQGYVRLPAQVRHRCDLRAGDRVLLAADPSQQMLRVYPPSTLDDLLAAAPDESDTPRGGGAR
jgi:bifunctional DNA-binding transcriptional regulator/antitoxin component of YhaV-PrlF toxin-antitoxin module